MPRLLRSAAPALLALVAIGFAGVGHGKTPPDWRLLLRARPRDHDRLRDWRLTWTAAIAQARAAGQGARIDREGVLLQPDVALAPPEPPPPGDYRCRAIRLGAVAPGAVTYETNPWHRQSSLPGAATAGLATYVELPPAPCRIGSASLKVLAGAQRPAVRFWPWDGIRDLALGAIAVGDEGSALPYGRDPDRNVVGFFDRIGPGRWRLVIPKPAWGAQIEIVEVTPAA